MASPPPPQSNGPIPGDIEIIGTLKLPDERAVTCRVEGEIHSPSTVIIPRGVQVKACIKAESAVIFGTVEGDVQVTGRAVLKSSSTLHGDIRAARVLVDEGATFNGKSHVNPGGTAVQKNAAPSRKTPEPTKKRAS
jgi:cytoskeletal protein CcmA (bactofilin family)